MLLLFVVSGTLIGAAVAVVSMRGNHERPAAPASGSAVVLDTPADASLQADAAVFDAAPPAVDAAPADAAIDAAPPIDASIASPPDAAITSPPPKPRPVITRPVPVGEGELFIQVLPWATVEIDGKPHGQTPFREKIPAGRHRLKLFHEDSGRIDRRTITIAPDQTTKISLDWR